MKMNNLHKSKDDVKANAAIDQEPMASSIDLYQQPIPNQTYPI